MTQGFPGGSDGKESACKAGNLGSIPGLGRFPWRREQLPTPVCQPEEFQGLYSTWGCKEWDMTEQLTFHFIFFSYMTQNLPFKSFICMKFNGLHRSTMSCNRHHCLFLFVIIPNRNSAPIKQ